MISRLLIWLDAHPGKAGALSGWYQQLCSGIVTLAFIPLVQARLGDASAGLWFSFQALTAAVGLTDFGISFVIARQVAFSRTVQQEGAAPQGDFLATAPGWAGISELYSATRSILRNVIAASVVLLVVVYELVIPHTALLRERSPEMRLTWYLLGLSAVTLVLTKLYQSFLDGLGKMHLGRLLAGSYQLFSGIVALAGLLAGGGLAVMAACVCMMTFVYLAVLRRRLLAEAAGQLNTRAQSSKAISRNLWKVAAPMGVVNASAYLVSAVQVPLIGMLLGPKLVAPFYAAQKIGQMLNVALMQVVSPQMPLFTSALAAGRKADAAARMRRMVTIVTGMALLVNATYLYLSPIFADHFWLGPGKYVDRLTLLILAIDYTAMVSSVVWAQFVLASGSNPFTRTTLIAGFLNVGGCVLFAPSMGILGIALSSLLAGCITNYWLGPARGVRLLTRLNAPSSPTV